MDKRSTDGIILAAGSSSSFAKPRPLLRIGSDFFLSRMVTLALASRLSLVVPIFGQQSGGIIFPLGQRLDDPRLHNMLNG
jgi:CTP:molybdopterin cytidylyltransferase MocA